MTDAPAFPYVIGRGDEGADPPTAAFAERIERDMPEGGSALFVEEQAQPGIPAGIFELRRHGGVFRVQEMGGDHSAAFASAQAAVRDGWAMVDRWRAVVLALSRGEAEPEQNTVGAEPLMPLPLWTYKRRLPHVDPPAPWFAADLQKGLLDGERALFIDDEARIASLFYLHRRGSVFFVEDVNGAHLGTFADVAAAVRAGWQEADRDAARRAAIEAWLTDDAPCPFPTGV